eukprot:jgi/Tetstr1/453934/TSEL_040853.t1
MSVSTTDVSQIAPRIAAAVKRREEFRDRADLGHALVAGCGLSERDSAEIADQLGLEWGAPRSKYEVLAAVVAWARFHSEFAHAHTGHRRGGHPG